ncbi:MAG: HAD-IA family hydrolase, partial [Acidiferrobacterales bacterium]
HRHGVTKTDEEILTAFAGFDDRHEQAEPEKPFTQMLPLIYRDMARAWGLQARDDDAQTFMDSIRFWPPFPDTVDALKELGTKYRLVAVTNADKWALKYMSATMATPFDEQVTCDEVGVNKPSPLVFEYMFKKLARLGVRRPDVLHTAQSQYHDIVPATELGIATMWIERRHGKDGYGATPKPEQVATPTFHATSMADFVRQVEEGR